MTISKEWEKCFKKNLQMSVWPWSDLVSYVMRYACPTGKDFRVLELGCGAGANIPFFTSLGVNYFAIDGSPMIIEILKKKFPSISKNIIQGDFTSEIPFEGNFDLIVDRCAITHNTTDSIKNCLSNIYDKLKKNGKYIGIDWFSTHNSDFLNGQTIDADKFTKTGYEKGMFTNVEQVHFSDKTHLLELFSDFEILHLEHKITKTEIPENLHQSAWWNIAIQKTR
jgi:SAM-dependent methyltransferase